MTSAYYRSNPIQESKKDAVLVPTKKAESWKYQKKKDSAFVKDLIIRKDWFRFFYYKEEGRRSSLEFG